MRSNPDLPGVVAPPPLLLFVAVVAGFVADHFLPLPIVGDQRTWRLAASVALLLLATAVFLAAVRELHGHHTTPNPYQPSTTVVSSSVYRLSRNPIYLAFLGVALAVAIAADSWWLLAATAALFLVLDLGVVRREERYLAARFGAAYDAYRRRVRRWL